MELEIRTPDRMVLRTRVSAVRAADASGWFGLLPGREPFLTLLAPGLITYRDEAGHESYAAADGGVLLLEGETVSIVTREAVVSGELETVAGAAADMLRERRQAERAARVEFAELQTVLLRELRKAERKP